MYSFIKNLGHFSAETITAKLAFGVALFAIALTLSMQNTPFALWTLQEAWKLFTGESNF